MRYRAHAFAVPALLLLLALPVAAQGAIHPIPRPDTTKKAKPKAKAPVAVKAAPAPSSATPSAAAPPAATTSTPKVTTPPAAKTPVQQTPVQKTPVHKTPVQKTTPPPASGTAGTGSVAKIPVHTAAPPEVVIHIGRDQSGAQLAVGDSGSATPVASAPAPTPLQLYHGGNPVHARAAATPAWKLGLLAVLAAAEAFLVVRLVRQRPVSLSPAA